jgi:predicted MPP superfamily phosphohydrolase
MLKRLISFILIIIIVISAISLYLSNYCIKVSRYSVTDAEIPVSFDGYRIAQLSDIHGRNINDKILKAVNKAKPHIIVITGDLMDDEAQWASVSSLLYGLLKAAPVYYVTGNHEWADTDTEDLLERIKQSGVTVLQNTYAKLTVGAESIVLAGLDDPNGYADMKTPEELAAEIQEYKGGRYSILLSHRPAGFLTYAALGYDLILSGHIHGGIVRLPFLGGLFGPGMELLPDYAGGIYNTYKSEQGMCTLVVSRGLSGIDDIPRLFNRLDIPVITLHTEN